MTTKRLVTLAGTVMILALAPTAFAQDFAIDWYTIDGGGGFSAGGDFELEGTIGQPDAGALTGGDFALTGGIWAVTTPGNLCPGDADGDGDTDISDLGLLLSNFGMAVTPGTDGDVNFSGSVDITDLGILLADFGCVP